MDPDPVEIDIDPFKYKIMARMYYYYLQLFSITPRLHMLYPIINRIYDMVSASDVHMFDRKPLLGRDGYALQSPLSLTTARSFVKGHNIYGEIIPFGGKYYFYGLDLNVVELLLKQDFYALNNYKSVAQVSLTNDVEVLCRIRESDIFRNETKLKTRKIEGTRWVETELYGRLYSNSAGRVIGVLN